MKYTVQCSYPTYRVRPVLVDAENPESAMEEAIVKADADGDDWKPLDDPGDNFVDAIVEGEHADPWEEVMLPIPHRFTEAGTVARCAHRGGNPEGQSLIEIIVRGGAVECVVLGGAFAGAEVRVRDYDVEGGDEDRLQRDGGGVPYSLDEPPVSVGSPERMREATSGWRIERLIVDGSGIEPAESEHDKPETIVAWGRVHFGPEELSWTAMRAGAGAPTGKVEWPDGSEAVTDDDGGSPAYVHALLRHADVRAVLNL